MKSLIGLVVVAVIGLVLSLAFRLGGFKDVKLGDEELGPHKTLHKIHVGAYHKIVPVIEEVEKWARANGEDCRLTFGEFLDDVENVAEDRLRSHAGCIVEKDWNTGLPTKLPEGYLVREIPRRRYVTAEFEGAPSIGPMKVYPKAAEKIAELGLVIDGPVIEMYEILPENKVRTRYLFPVKPR